MPLEEVQHQWDAGMTSTAPNFGAADRAQGEGSSSTGASTDAEMERSSHAAAGATARVEHRSGAAQGGRTIGGEPEEGANEGDEADAGRSGGPSRGNSAGPTRRGRVARVAFFADWAKSVVADEPASTPRKRPKRPGVAHGTSGGGGRPDGHREGEGAPLGSSASTSTGGVSSQMAADGDGVTPREAGGLITLQPDEARGAAPAAVQIGARERRTTPVGRGFRVTDEVTSVVCESEQNDAESERRKLREAVPAAVAAAVPSDDEQRRQRRALTADRGRRCFGSRQQDALAGILRNAGDCVLSGGGAKSSGVSNGARKRHRHERSASDETHDASQRGRSGAQLRSASPGDRSAIQGEGRKTETTHLRVSSTDSAAALLGDSQMQRAGTAQRQRADAYAAAAARAGFKGGRLPTPVAAGSSVPEGVEAAAAAAMTMDDIIKLPSYSMARIAHESDEFVRRAPYPVTNQSPPDGPMPPVDDAGEGVADPSWRPSTLTDVYTPEAIRRIMAWFEEMRRYEENGRAKRGCGLRRPTDLILDDEFVRPKARGRAWYLLDHIRSGGAAPIVPIEEAKPLEPVINSENVRALGRDYHDKRVLDQLCGGHRNLSSCPRVTVLSANHAGAIKFHEAIAKQFAGDSSPELGWLQPVVDAGRPLQLELDGEKVTISGFVATCPARVEPCNGVQQNDKVRTTTDKSWPKLEVLDAGSDELAVNPMIALDELAKSEFPKTTQFAAATAVLMQAESAPEEGISRGNAAAAAPHEFVHLWKIDLQSAYRFWHNHPTELWMYGKQWDGSGYLDCRTQFGDASMVQDFSRFTDYFLWLLRRLRDGDARLRRRCASFGAPLWEAIDRQPAHEAYRRWREDREAAGLSDGELALSFEAGYIDDIFGAALGAERAEAMRDLAVGLARFLGFEVAPKKIAGPSPCMTVLGAALDLEMRLLSLDPDKALSYSSQAAATLSKKSMRLSDFLSLTCKLVHAAQYRPAGRPYLTCCFTAMRQATRAGAKRVRIGRGVVRELKWWAKHLVLPNDGVAFFPLNHFPPSGSPELLEFAYDASGTDGLGAAMLRPDASGNLVCYFVEHMWTDEEKCYHINVKEGIAGYAGLASFYPMAPHRHALAHGDNTTETITSAKNKSRSALQSVVLQHRAEFAGRTGVVTRVRRVKSKDNVLADPVSRLATATFKAEARKLGATKFVKLPLAPEVQQLIDELGVRLGELREDGEPTSGTARNVSEVYEREQRYIDMQSEKPAPGVEDDDDGGAAPERWGYVAGFCGADSMAFAAEPLGGVPMAGFDIDATVRELWHDRTGFPCWGDFAAVHEAAQRGALDWLRALTLVYISGSPCPDFSKAGVGRGLAGYTGSLWLDDCELGIRLRPPIIIREMVTGIFDFDGGAPVWAAADRYRDAGYAVSWAVRMARRHGDPTSRRRVFLLAILPECLVDGAGEADFFSAEGTSSDEVTVERCFGSEVEARLLVPQEDVMWLPERDNDGYDGPRLTGTIGVGGMGWSVYDSKGPAVTQKTWGQGPGGATALYLDSEGRVRRLSPWEALRTHSFPETFVDYLRETPLLGSDGEREETVYRLCGNSIPINMLADVVAHAVALIKPQVKESVAAALAEHEKARARS